MNKLITLSQAVSHIKDDMTVMVGGFLGCGSANTIIAELVKIGIKNLTMISNDTAFPDRGNGLLIAGGNVSHLIVSHVGTNPLTGEKMNSGEIEVEFSPQGTLAERIRCGGAGLGGVLTKTGLGTIVADGKPTFNIDGEEWLYETPLRADVALIYATVADRSGNLVYSGTTQNFNPLMAMAADTVIVEAEKVVEVGQIAPEQVHTSGIFVDYIYERDKQ